MQAIAQPNYVPIEWIETLHDGTKVMIRPIRREDAELERDLLARLSPESIRLRFLGRPDIADPATIHRLTDINWDTEAALVALVHRDGRKQEIGVARFALSPDGQSCECAVVVRDDWRSRGLGTALMKHLIEFARGRGIRTMISFDAADNARMRDLAKDLGFSRMADRNDPTLVVHSLRL